MNQTGIASTLPIAASDVAHSWDALYGFLVWLSVFFFILVVGGMIYFAVRYRSGTHPKAKYSSGNVPLEIVWTIIPTLLLMVIFAWGWVVYKKMIQAPADAMEVRVIGKQWLWQFQYADGRTSAGELYVPVDQAVKLVMSSEDVLHSFFIPNFRVKQDVVPGMYTSVWFRSNVPGKHQVYCAEYCGGAHSGMLAQIVVLTSEQWSAWKQGAKLGEIPVAGQKHAAVSDDRVESSAASAARFPEGTLVAQGKKHFEVRGCVACHSADGSAKLGPSLKGLYGGDVALSDGRKVRADENYLRKSIENPNAEIVRGFSAVMPTFKGLLTEQEMNAVIAYIQSLN